MVALHPMKIALTADWLPVFAGAEHVLYEFTQLWPDAPIFTTVANKSRLGALKDADIRVSPLQKYYKMVRRHQPLLPWMPRAMENIDLRGYDVFLLPERVTFVTATLQCVTHGKWKTSI